VRVLAQRHDDTSTAEQDQIVLGRALRDLRRRADMTQEAMGDRLAADATLVGRHRAWSPCYSLADPPAFSCEYSMPTCTSSHGAVDRAVRED